MTPASIRPVLTACVVGMIAVTACGAPAVPSGAPVAATATRAATESGAATPIGPAATASPAPAAGTSRAGVTIAADVAIEGLTDPVDVANASDGSGRLFVVEQAGIIRVIRDGAALEPPFLDIGERIASGGERGMLGLAFHPDYPSDPRFFVDYTDIHGDTVVASFAVDASTPDIADPRSETILLQVTQPFANHNGGAVAFGPDGMLYVALGDGGSGGDPQGNGQRLDTLLAKILRIDVDDPPSGKTYTVPSDNPFVAAAGAKPEIWLTGLRNPWRMRFDAPTRDLWIGDVGQNAWEEIDVARGGVGGLDFGWNRMEGFHCFEPASGCDQSGLTMPVTAYGHKDGCAVIGGVVVRDARQGKLDGGYLFGDACSDRVWVIDPTSNGPQTPVLAGRLGRTLSSIGEGEDATVYATSPDNGELLRLSAGG